jgi:hypothetical protein
VQPTVLTVAQPAPAIAIPRLNDAQMNDLTASIALYPDPLLAVMLPSATFPEDLCFADRWQEQHPGAPEALIATLPVDDSVKAMMHYPAALDVLVGHIDWTQSLALAFTYQRQDLFNSIQRWRATALAYGTLSTTPQQQVIQQGTLIVIQPPPTTQVVYVPVYDPAVVFVRPTVIRPAREYINFSTSGFSLSFAINDVDWRSHEIRVPRRDWDDRYDRGERGGSRGGPGGPPPGGDRGGAGGPPPGGDRGGRGGAGPGPGRGTLVDSKTVFVPKDLKPGRVYPEKVLTPQPDKKVISLPGSSRGPGDRGDLGGPSDRGGPSGRGGLGGPGGR